MGQLIFSVWGRGALCTTIFYVILSVILSVMQSYAELFRVMQSYAELCRVMQSYAELYRVMEEARISH